jgi:hypothetical protein
MKALSLVLLAGCWSNSQPSQPAAPDVSVMVELAAVTLGDDCGDNVHLTPPPREAAVVKPRKLPPGAAIAPSDLCQGCVVGPSHCDQTSMQLALKTSGAGSTSVAIKKVELLDNRGNFLAELAARGPTKWDGSSYVAWDQQVTGDQRLAASYLLSSPDWDKLTNGRWSAHQKTFQLRVTMAVGSKDRTIDKQSITPAMLEPPVPT